MKLAEFLLNLTNLGVRVLVYSPDPGFWIICLRYEMYHIKRMVAKYELSDNKLSLDGSLLMELKLCAEDLSNLLCISKIEANHVVGNRIVELLSKED